MSTRCALSSALKKPLLRSCVRLANALAVSGAVLLWMVGCAALDRTVRPTAPYEGAAVQLFDDALDPSAVGLNLDGATKPADDPILRRRALESQAILRVRVLTVTSRSGSQGSTYDVILAPAGQIPAGTATPLPEALTKPVPMVVAQGSETASIVRAFEGRLVGKTFIAFARGFVRPDGEEEYHFHLAPDTKAVSDAVSLALQTR